MTLNDKLNLISTIIQVQTPFGQSQGSGFFYQTFGEDEINADGNAWQQINELWLITNKHVVGQMDRSGNLILPDQLTFNLRKNDNGQIKWFPITLNNEELRKRVKIHKNPVVDIAAVNVIDLIHSAVADSSNNIIGYAGVSENDLPGKNLIDVEVCDDVITIGYPKGFYDTHNLYPIVKSGIIASRWGGHFNGLPYVLIDSKLFPGSSGSLVISRPINQLFSKGHIYTAQEKQFAFLGVYSGEPFLQSTPIEFDDFTIVRKDGFNLGVVWYSYLIPQIVNDGVSI